MVYVYVDFYEYYCGLNLYLFDMKFNVCEFVNKICFVFICVLIKCI